MLSRSELYLDGEWREAAAAAGVIDVEDPYTETVFGQVPAASSEQLDEAVRAARVALAANRLADVASRAALLEAIAAGLERRSEELAILISQEVGTPIRVSRRVQVALPIAVLRQTASVLSDIDFTVEVGNSVINRVPIGVVGAITPWNYPLHQVVGKFAAALAAGCPLVLKPSEVAPLSSFVLAEVAAEAGVPAGYFNVVPGTGPTIGAALAAHPGIDAVSFTGSVEGGRQVALAAAGHLARVTLELGGKSASVVLGDADLATAVKVSVANCLLNAGQTCTAWTRLIVPRARLAEVEQLCQDAVAGYRLGAPQDEHTRLGPLASRQQRERVQRHLAAADRDGARRVPTEQSLPDRGYFVAPVVFSDLRPDSPMVQDEIFGPVLCLLAHDGDDDAVRLANDTRYGLAGGVWSTDLERGARVARRLRTGAVDINGAAFNPAAPFGGFGDSGYGRELGRFGIEEFLATTSVQY